MLDRESVVLAMLPLFHVFGLNAVLGSWAMAGARLVIMDGFDGFAEVLAGEAITNVPLAPPVLARIMDDERCRRQPRVGEHRRVRCRAAAG